MADAKAGPAAGVVILGLSLLTLGGLLWAWSEPPPSPAAAAGVVLRVESPEGGALYERENMTLPAANATALGALLQAAREGNFSVNVTYAYQGDAFVDEIGGYPNRGSCGWVYSVDGVKPPFSAARTVLRDFARLRWFWGCEG